MADIELVIKIPEEVKQAFDCAESNDLKDCYYDHSGVIGNAIKNGTPLPKNHGRLIDANALIRKYAYWMPFGLTQRYVVGADSIASAPTIIKADKEGEKE